MKDHRCNWPGCDLMMPIGVWGCAKHTSKLSPALIEEIAEIDDASTDAERFEEAGDFLFAAANLVRAHGIAPEEALRAANAKFTRRFSHIEKVLAERGSSPEQSDLAEMDALWDEAKALERKAL